MHRHVSRFGVAALLACLWTMPPCGAQKPTTAEITARREIEAVSRRAEADTERRDVKASMQYYADDFQGQDIDGSTWNKKQAEKSLTKSLSIVKNLRSHSIIKDVRLDHGKAIVLSEEHTTGDVVGKKTGKVHKVVFDGTWRSTWVRQSGTWRVWREKHLTRSITNDGKVVVPKR